MCDSTARISTSLWISDFLETCNGSPRRWNRTSLATSLTSRVLSESEDLFLLGSDLGYNSQLYLRPQALFRRHFALVVEFDATSEQSLSAVNSKYIFLPNINLPESYYRKIRRIWQHRLRSC